MLSLRPNGERHLLATVRDSRRPQPRHGGESGGRRVRTPIERDGIAMGIRDCAGLAASAMSSAMRIDAKKMEMSITRMTVAIASFFHGVLTVRFQRRAVTPCRL